MLNSKVASILSGVLVSLSCGFISAQEQKFESYFAPAAQVQSLDKTERNLWGGLSLAPNEPTPESSLKLHSQQNTTLPSSKAVCWISDDLTFENPIFDEPMLERYGITSTLPDLRTGARFYSKSMVFPFTWLSGRHRSRTSPLDRRFKK